MHFTIHFKESKVDSFKQKNKNIDCICNATFQNGSKNISAWKLDAVLPYRNVFSLFLR